MNTRTDIINHLIEKHGFKSYLEIGTGDGNSFKAINVEKKKSVDPINHADFRMTSDDYFLSNKAKYDLIFVDGDHHADQAFADIFNALDRLRKGGIVVVHDCDPRSEEMQTVPYLGQSIWTGDVWKAWVKTRLHYNGEKNMFVIDSDFGVGIIADGESPKLSIKGELDYPGFVKNREKWLNLISVEQFKTL